MLSIILIHTRGECLLFAYEDEQAQCEQLECLKGWIYTQAYLVRLKYRVRCNECVHCYSNLETRDITRSLTIFSFQIFDTTIQPILFVFFSKEMNQKNVRAT